MRFKLDENLGNRGAILLRGSGHDVATVVDQAMTSATDAALIEACRREGRCLVSLDLDFANPIRFPPVNYAGIVVLRCGHPVTTSELETLLVTLIEALQRADVTGKLWIVERGRVREYAPDDGGA